MPSAREVLRRWPRLQPKTAGLLLAATLGVSVILGEAYAAAAYFIEPTWLAALVLNLLLAVVVVSLRWRRGAVHLFAPVAWRWFAPAGLVLLLCAVVAGVSRLVLMPSELPAESIHASVPWAWLLAVPVAEEVVFRGGLGQGLVALISLQRRKVSAGLTAGERHAPRLWAAWFSAAAFALVHAQPTLSHWWAGQVGLAVGPFLLGLACEALLAGSGSLWPGILLHAACNATVVVFQTIDERWLTWLKILYS